MVPSCVKAGLETRSCPIAVFAITYYFNEYTILWHQFFCHAQGKISPITLIGENRMNISQNEGFMYDQAGI
jgi:hypothetical protein